MNTITVRLTCILILIALLGGCSSDPETPLGSEFVSDSILGSRPGHVFKDTLATDPADTSFALSSLLTSNTFLTLGRRDDYRTSMVIRADLPGKGSDTTKTVVGASLRLRFTDNSQTDVIGARFYEMLEPFSEGDTITSLELNPDAIPDEDLTNVDREMKLLGDYTLPPALVEGWIKGDIEHTGIAVVPSDTTLSTQITFGSRENGDVSQQPFLAVTFDDGSDTTYAMTDDATFVEWLGATSNLIVSDGYTQRVFIPVDIGGLVEDAAIHKADLVLTIVPGSEIGNEFDVRLYTPNSSVVGNPDIFDGVGITTYATDIEDGQIVLPVRNVLLFFLEGVLPNNGFVLQFSGEGSQIRQLEFYSAEAGPDLGPHIIITYSTPADFLSGERE